MRWGHGYNRLFRRCTAMWRYHVPQQARTIRGSLWTIAWLVLPMALVGCGPTGGYKITPIPVDKTLEETVIMREPGLAVADKIAVIDVDGVIINARKGGLFTRGDNPVSLLTEKLTAASNDNHVRAVVLRINSPGGGVAASNLMYDEIKHFKERTGRPVVAMMLDLAASGGYYVACACDDIIAHRTTVTGSIGVIMMTLDLSGALKRIYIKPNIIKSAPMKDSGSPFREMKPEDRAIFQNLIDGYHEQFVGVVDAGRPKLSTETVRELADGRIYSAQQALENGLVDRIGTMRDAVALAKQRSGAKKVRVVMYHRPLGWTPNYYAHAPAGGPSTFNLINLNLSEWLTPATPKFLYLWAPME